MITWKAVWGFISKKKWLKEVVIKAIDALAKEQAKEEIEKKEQEIKKLKNEIELLNKFRTGVCGLSFKVNNTSDDDPNHPYCSDCQKPMLRGYHCLVCAGCGKEQDLRVLRQSECKRLMQSKVFNSPEPTTPTIEGPQLDIYS